MTEKEKQYFEVMLEQILHEVKTVAEGHCVLDEKLDRFHNESKEDHRLAMDLIKFSHDELKGEIQSVRTELREEMASGFNTLGSKVDGHEDRVRFLERKVA